MGQQQQQLIMGQQQLIMGQQQQLFSLQQLLGGAAWSWISVALLACLFLVLVLHPERIQRRGQFKAACSLLVLSIIVPSLLNVLLILAETSASAWSSGARSSWFIAQGLVGAAGPILAGAGTFFGLMSLMPSEPRSPFPEPTRHPLE